MRGCLLKSVFFQTGLFIRVSEYPGRSLLQISGLKAPLVLQTGHQFVRILLNSQSRQSIEELAWKCAMVYALEDPLLWINERRSYKDARAFFTFQKYQGPHGVFRGCCFQGLISRWEETSTRIPKEKKMKK